MGLMNNDQMDEDIYYRDFDPEKDLDWLWPELQDAINKYIIEQLTIDIIMQDTYNEETVGTAQTLVNYGKAVEHMRSGGIVSRVGWNGKGMFVFKQVPSKVPSEVVPRMTSLPDSVKDRLFDNGISPNYRNQMAIVNPNTGDIDSWVASSGDTFAEDWILE